MPPTGLTTKTRPPPLVLDDTSTDSTPTGCTDLMDDWQDAQGSPVLFQSQDNTPVVPMQPPRPQKVTEVPETPPHVLEAARRKRTMSETSADCGVEGLEQRAVEAHNAVLAAVAAYEKVEMQFREYLEKDATSKLEAAAEEIRTQRDAGFKQKLTRLAELEQTRQKGLREDYEEAVHRLKEKYEADCARADKAHKKAIMQLHDDEEKAFISQYKALEAEFKAGVDAGVKRIGRRAKAARVERV